MYKILRMEYIFIRRQILIVLTIFTPYFAYMASQVKSPRVFLVTTSIMIGLTMPFLVMAREDKFKTSSLICSLPVRRSTVVLGKYVSSWAAIVIGLVYALVFTAILPFSKVPVGAILTAKSLFICLFLISLFFSILLPFTTRFGFVGVIILLVGGQLLGIVALLLTQMLGRAKNPLRVVLRAAEKSLRFLLYHESTPGYLLALLAATVAVIAASFFISRALYARRDL